MKAVRQLTRLNNDLKAARVAIIRDGEHHLENYGILQAKAPSHARAITESLELGGVSAQILEDLLKVANEEFSSYVENLPPFIKSRLQEISQEPSPVSESTP
jgi:hypothetical protein